MKHPVRFSVLPFFTLLSGALGLILRLWLYAGMDENGLLPANHPAGWIVFLLAALTVGILFFATRKLPVRPLSRQFVRLSGCCACALSGIGLILDGLLHGFGSTGWLAGAATAASLMGGLSLFYMAMLQYAGKQLPYWLPGILTVALMLVTVAQCRVWGAVPQLQIYFFPLMASVFLILSAYEKTVLSARQSRAEKLAFFSQCALFFCCLSLNTEHWTLYLGMLCWTAVQLYPCIQEKQEG